MNLILLLAAAICFPSAPELWKAGPLTSETMKIPAAPVIASGQQLQAQFRLFSQLRSPFQRSRMAIEFGEADSPAACPLLLRLLETEKNVFVQDNLLESLLRLQRKGYAVQAGDEQLIRFFQAASPSARSAAAVLYLSGKHADPTRVLEAFQKETSVPVLNRLLEALRPFASKISQSQIGNLYERTPADNIGLRSLTVELLAAGQENPDGSVLLQKALQDPDPVIRMHAVRGLAANPSGNKLLAAAAADSHPAVRLAAAGIVKPDPARTAILGKLLTDPAPAVRAAAARSLGAGSNGAAELLCGALADPEIAVRRSVAAALIRLKPAKKLHERIVKTGDKNPSARRQALAFLVGTLDRNHEGAILRWIRQSKDPLFLREAAAALGTLNCRRSGEALIRLSISKDDKIRAAATESIGKLKLPQTFPVLARLCRDANIEVAEAAFMAMYRISDRSFVPEFEWMAGRFSEDGANCRAIACRALAAFPLSSRVIANLDKLITTACIRVPMAGPMPDADHVRISALLLLREHAGKGDRAARSAYQKNMQFLDLLRSGSELKSDDFDEFLRQLKAADSGRPVQPKTIESVQPQFTTAPAGKRK